MKRSLNELLEFPIDGVITPNWSTISGNSFMLVYANQWSEKSDNIFTPKFLSLTFQSHFPLSFEMEWKRFVFQNWSWQRKIFGNLQRKNNLHNIFAKFKYSYLSDEQPSIPMKCSYLVLADPSSFHKKDEKYIVCEITSELPNIMPSFSRLSAFL